MLLTNAYDPDPRVRQEALALIGMGCRVRLLAWDRDLKAPLRSAWKASRSSGFSCASSTRPGHDAAFLLRLALPEDVVARIEDLVRRGPLPRSGYLAARFLLGKLKRKPIVYDAHESFPDMLEGSVHPAVRRGWCGWRTS